MPPRPPARGDLVRVEALAEVVEAEEGVPVPVTLQVTNLDHVIHAFEIDVLGLDREHVQLDPTTVELFPDERRAVTLLITLPAGHPAGRHQLGVRVRPVGEDAPTLPALRAAPTSTAVFELVVAPRRAFEMTVEPATVESGAVASFVVGVTNTGNAALQPVLVAEEPERVVTCSFEPVQVEVAPGDRALITMLAEGPRPWFGNPAVRVLEIAVATDDSVRTQPVVWLQRPRISRRLLAFLGLLAVATLFAFVISLAFRAVAAENDENVRSLRAGLGEERVGSRGGAAELLGSVRSTTTGPLAGATIELFAPDNPLVAVRSTVSTGGGAFRLAGLPAGEYLVRVEAAGFDAIWVPSATTFADAEPVTVTVDGTPPLEVELVGRPGSIAGTVLGEAAGAVVTVQLPADAAQDGADAVAAVVASTTVDATGAFQLGDLPTPATYELVVEQAGFARDVRTVTLGPGETIDGVDVLLRLGDGRITGQVLDTSGAGLPSATITATAVSTTVTTRSLGGDDAGSFELRDLPTPETYTLTVSAPGFVDETVTVALDELVTEQDLVVVLRAAVGSITGTVLEDGRGLGGVDVVVDGAGVRRSTVTVTDGAVGNWSLGELPAPGVYTVTFSRDGYDTQAISVSLGTGGDADRRAPDVTLASSLRTVAGRVVDADGGVVGVEVLLEGADVERRTLSAAGARVRDDGAFRFDRLPTGVYTLTFVRPGSRPQTLLVDVFADDRTGIEVLLEPQARITGRVVRQGGAEAGAGVTVHLASEYPTRPLRSVVTDREGRFELVGLDAPETYVLDLAVPAGGPVVASQVVELTAGQQRSLGDWAVPE